MVFAKVLARQQIALVAVRARTVFAHRIPVNAELMARVPAPLVVVRLDKHA